jgi:multiphosphoryl transfer protein
MAEQTLRGLPASPGVAVGPVWPFPVDVRSPAARPVESVDEERRRLRAASDAAVADLEELLASGDERLTDDDLAIFEAHRMIVEDPELAQRVEREIAGGESAEAAWTSGIEAYVEILESLDNETLRARAADVRDVGRRVLRHLSGAPARLDQPGEPSIVVAEDLTPSDTIDLDPDRVLGFATQRGGPTSHASILARRMGVPAVVGLGKQLGGVAAGAQVILDGAEGTLVVAPDVATAEAARSRREHWLRARGAAAEMARAGTPRTRDEVAVEVAANVGSLADAEQAAASGADGIGLLRTEFLYMGRDTAPDEDELTGVLRRIIDAAGGGLVVVRTLDVGGDKPHPFLPMTEEANPFLGVRGIRLSRAHPTMLETQVAAVLRAAAGARLGIMFPMVATVDEVVWARGVVDEAASRLAPEHRPSELQVGIMVEVPSAALLADRLAPEMDFFSIGTNDLAQYTLAADRTNPAVAAMADGLHPAVLRLIGMVAAAGNRHGIWVGVCGELAADVAAVPLLIGLGVRELSVNPISVPEIKLEVTRWDSEEAASLAEQALALGSGDEVRELVAGHRGESGDG